MSQDDDVKILIGISKGDSKCFESLMNKYQNLVYGYSMKMLKNKSKAEDVTQETWLRVVKNAFQYRPTGSVKSWLMSITRNLVIDEYRSAKKWVELADEDWNSIEDAQSDIEKMFGDNERSDQLKAAFDSLPENQKIILSMVLIEELSQSEVSVKLNITVGAVKAVLFRARENLKKAVGVL